MDKYSDKLFKSYKVTQVISLIFFGCSILVKGSPYSVPSARITLLSLERGHLRTITNEVNHEVVLTVPTKYFEAYSFECNASYPVEWNYIGDGAPTATADVGRHFKDFYDVSTYTYQSILFLYNLEELQSGKYICRGSNPEQEKLQIFYDLFVPGNGNRTFLSTVEKEVFVSELKPIVFIPCTISDPTVGLNLYKGTNMGTYQRIETNQSIIFYPKKGFRLKMHELPDPFGNYMCTTHDNKRRRKINLIPERLKSKYEASSPLTGKIPVQFSYDYEFNRMLCCTGTPFVPKLQWAGCGSVLDCKIKSVCFEEDRCEARLGGSSTSPSKWIDPGPLPKGCSGWKLRDDPNGDHGIFKCSSPGVSQYQPYLLNRGNIFLDFEKAPPSEAILSLVKTSEELPYVGSEVEYHCNSTRFYFGYGIRWAFQRGNGDIEFVEDSTVIRDRYFVTAHRRQTTLKILHQDIKAIICFVPIANSATEWRTVSLPILVRESFNIPFKSGLGERPEEFLSNEIPYNPKPHLYEPHSTHRPKDFFNYHTSEDILTSNHPHSPDIISSPVKSASVSLIDSKPLHETKIRDYLYSSPNNNPMNQVQNNPINQVQNNPMNQAQNYPTRSNPRIWDSSASASQLGTSKHQPTGYYNIHTNQFEHLGLSHKETGSLGSIQSSPTVKPKLNYESQPQDINYSNYNSWPKYSNEYQKLPIQSSQRVRDDYSNYETSTTRPQGYHGYQVNSHEHIPSNQNIQNVFSSVRTSPTPILQPVIHYDKKDKEYSLRYPSTELKTYSNNPIGLSHTIKEDHRGRYPTPIPTLSSPSHYYYDKASHPIEGRLSVSKPAFPPQEDSHGSIPVQYGQNYRSSSETFNQVKNRLKLTTQSPPLYYNPNNTSHHHSESSWERPPPPQSYKKYEDYNPNNTSHHQSEPSWERPPPPQSYKKYEDYNPNNTSHHQSEPSWERPPPPQSYKKYEEYEREERQYYNPRVSPPLKNVEDQSSTGTDEHFYYQRYASESQEFPVEHGSAGARSGPIAPSYSSDNFMRRSDSIYGDSVPFVELG